MRRSVLTKPLFLCLALVVVLGGTGLGAAHWSGTLDIGGTVETGTICVGWYGWSLGDPGTQDDYVWDPVQQIPVQATQHVGTGTIAPVGTPICVSPVVPGGTPLSHYKTLQVTVSNAYPYYYVDFQVHWHNCGTLPVMVTHFDITGDVDDPSTPGIIEGPLYVEFLNGFLPEKMHPCDKYASSLIIWCRQADDPDPGDPGVEPSQTYTFTLTIYYEQAQ